MNQLNPAEIPAFLKQFRFRKARLRRIRIINRGKGEDPAIEILLLARSNPLDLSEPVRVRLRLWLERVGEFRFQQRPNARRSVLNAVVIGYLQGMFFLNLDPWDIGDEKPALMDFRGSEAYAACQELYWEVEETPRTREDPS